MSERQQIKLTFSGGADSIGASCTLLEVNGTCLLIDCGIRMNAPDRPLPDLFALGGKQIDAILLTHAHTDHTGALPVLCDAFPSVPVYATPPTIDLIGILFNDAVKIIERERDGEIPLYSRAQVENVFLNTIPIGFRQPKDIKTVTVTFLPASHIIGAAMVHIATPLGNVLFTGDYSVTATGTMTSLDKPVLPVDLLISESTYGTRLHEDRKVAEERLVHQVNEILQRDGKVLIPSFAVGRAQEVILILQKALRSKKLPEIPVYIDGMVRDVCAIYSRYESYVTSSLAKQIRRVSNPFFTDSIRPVTTPQMRNKILSEGPCVIVSSSGMLTGGASAFYAQKMLGNENDGILLTGYQDEESPGRKLLSLATNNESRLFEMYGTPVEVKATVATFNLSAHADRLQMASLIESVRPRTVVLVHGDTEARVALKNSLQINDCMLVNNGECINRAYPFRSNNVAAVKDLPEKTDITRIRAILGTPGKGFVKASDAAQLWFERKTDALHIEKFVQRIEEFGVARRDDVRRNFLHVLETEETDSLEYQLEVRLKNENPKGKLIESCMKRKIEFPFYTIESREGYFHASARIMIDNKEIVSKVCKALSKITAQQLASEELLLRVQEEYAEVGEATEEIGEDLRITIDDQKKEQLKIDNPKGKLCEFFAVNKLKMPLFFNKVYSGMQLVKIRDRHSSFETSWYSAETKKIAEQGASEEFLSHLLLKDKQETSEKQGDSKLENTKVPSKSGSDPRIMLNNFLQKKQIIGFGYDLIGTDTTGSQIVFTMTGWALLPDDTRIETSQKSAFSKKDAQFKAASELMEKIYTID